MKVLVTGTTGLIGSAVQQRLEAANIDVTSLSGVADGDLRFPEVANALICSDKPDVVVHCAARLGGVAEQKADPSMPVLDSLLMGAQVIDACAKAGAKLVFLSSSTVYPSFHPAATEREYTAATEAWPRAPEPQYRGVAGMKIYLEDLIDFYAETYKLDATILRPTAVYGPGDRSHHVIPDLLRRADAGEMPLSVWGSGEVVRDFVYVDDVAQAVLDVLELGEWGGIFNIGSGERTTISKLADEVLLAVHGPHKIVELEDRCSTPLVRFDATKPTAIPWRAVSIKHAEDVLGWKPTVSLHDGLRRTLSWMRAMQSAQAGHA